jgi:hypothetical protein
VLRTPGVERKLEGVTRAHEVSRIRRHGPIYAHFAARDELPRSAPREPAERFANRAIERARRALRGVRPGAISERRIGF